MFKTFITA